MDRTEAIEHLKVVLKTCDVQDEEAVEMAIAALEGKDTNVPAKESITMEWIGEYLAWLKGIGGFGLSDARAIQSMIIKWKMDNPQKHSGCGPDYCDIGGEG